jgi:pyruvate-ferredoxin/flavodoxin oxidoreductase
MECDYKKSNSRSVSHVRTDSQPIKTPYLIENADFIACESISFLENDNV